MYGFYPPMRQRGSVLLAWLASPGRQPWARQEGVLLVAVVRLLADQSSHSNPSAVLFGHRCRAGERKGLKCCSKSILGRSMSVAPPARIKRACPGQSLHNQDSGDTSGLGQLKMGKPRERASQPITRPAMVQEGKHMGRV